MRKPYIVMSFMRFLDLKNESKNLAMRSRGAGVTDGLSNVSEIVWEEIVC